MNKRKKISLVAVLMLIMISLSACTTDAKLTAAVLKQQKVESFKARTDYSFKISAEGLSEEDMVKFNMVEDYVNKLSLSLDQISKTDAKKEKAEAKLYLTGKLGEDLKKATIWVEAEMKEGKEPKIVEVFKLPNEILSLMGEDFKGKDYIVYDLGKLMDSAVNEELDQDIMKELVEWSNKVQPRLEKVMMQAVKSFDPKLNLVEKVGKQSIEGQELDLYRVKISDAQLKELIKYSINYMLEDKEFTTIIDEYLEILEKTILKSGGDVEGFKAATSDKKAIKESINKFLDSLNNIQILSEKGLTMDLGINKDGFISYEKTSINLLLDLDNINKDKEAAAKGKIHLTVDYKTNLSRINDKSLDINMPKTSKENSIYLVDIMEKQIKEMEKAQETIKAE